MASYWDDKEQTDSVMRKDENGTLWMHTGDQATLDSDGYLRGAFTPFLLRTAEHLLYSRRENKGIQQA